MAKSTGLAWTECNIDNASGTAQDIRNDVTNLEFSTPYNSQEVTGLDKSAMERLLLLADAQGTLNTVFNPSANRAHAVLSGDMRVVRTVDLVFNGVGLSIEALFTDYAVTRAATGELTTTHPYALSDGTVPTWT